MAEIRYVIQTPSSTRIVNTTTQAVIRQAQQRLADWMSVPARANDYWDLLDVYGNPETNAVVGPLFVRSSQFPSTVTTRRFTVDGTLGPMTMTMAFHRMADANIGSQLAADARRGTLSRAGMQDFIRIAENDFNPQSTFAIEGNPSLPTIARPSSGSSSTPRSTPRPVPARPGTPTTSVPSATMPSTQQTPEPVGTTTTTTETNEVVFKRPSTWPWWAWGLVGTGSVLALGTVAYAVAKPRQAKRPAASRTSKRKTR